MFLVVATRRWCVSGASPSSKIDWQTLGWISIRKLLERIVPGRMWATKLAWKFRSENSFSSHISISTREIPRSNCKVRGRQDIRRQQILFRFANEEPIFNSLSHSCMGPARNEKKQKNLWPHFKFLPRFKIELFSLHRRPIVRVNVRDYYVKLVLTM